MWVKQLDVPDHTMRNAFVASYCFVSVADASVLHRRPGSVLGSLSPPSRPSGELLL